MKLKILIGSLLVAATSSSAALDRPPRLPPQPHYKLAAKYRAVRDFDICIVRMTGRYGCWRKQELRGRLAYLSEDDRDLIMGVVDRINGEVGNKTADQMLVRCTGEWRSVTASNPRTGRPGKTGRIGGKMELLRASAIRGVCAAGTAPGPRSKGDIRRPTDYDRQVESVKAGFDLVHDSCSESTTAPVAWGGRKTTTVRARVGQTAGIWNAGFAEWDDYEQSEQQMGIILRTRDSSEAAGLLQLLKSIEEAAKAIQHATRSGEDRQAERELAALRKAQAEEEAAREPQEQKAKQCLEADQCTQPDASRSLPPGGGDGTSCAERKAAWEAFKGRCDRSDWRSYECIAFVRNLNGCVDMRRIRPGPEGDLTCPAPPSEADRQAQEKRECERRGQFARPVPGGSFNCERPPVPFEKPKVGIDICTGPTTTPGPDTHCPAPRPNRR